MGARHRRNRATQVPAHTGGPLSATASAATNSLLREKNYGKAFDHLTEAQREEVAEKSRWRARVVFDDGPVVGRAFFQASSTRR